MSTEVKEVVAADTCCASCGKAGIDDVKLKDCDAGCKLVKYCSVVCKRNHRARHMIACKERAAELRDKIYLRSQMKATGESAQFVFCRCQLK